MKIHAISKTFGILACAILMLFCACHREKGRHGHRWEESDFPDTIEVKILLENYCEYVDNEDYEELAELYAPNVIRYMSQYDLTREEVIACHQSYNKAARIYGKHSSFRWNTLTIDSIEEGRVSIICVQDYRIDCIEKDKKSSYIFERHFIIDDKYQILSDYYVELEDQVNAALQKYYEEFDDDENGDELDYIPRSVAVPEGASLEDVFRELYSIPLDDEDSNIGGAKLIAEHSADVQGVYKSANETGLIPILHIRPLHEIKFILNRQPRSPVMLIRKKVIEIYPITINSGGLGGGFNVYVTVENLTNDSVGTLIPQGQMLETIGSDVQSVVIEKDLEISLSAYEKKSVQIHAWCASHYRGSPIGLKARITPYLLDAPREVFRNQDDVWAHIEAPQSHRLVFYAYAKGTRVGDHESKKGHAFVRIPDVGYVGFGSSGGYWGTDGRITEHSRYAQIATDSCVVYISDFQLSRVKSRLGELKQNTPTYNLAIYDCTSFVMDIADAAGIYYGNRLIIQTPTGFMNELKKYTNH